MTAPRPYEPGDLVAVLGLEDDKVVVTETTVLRIEPDAVEGRWKIETDHGGWTTTDSSGVGTYAVPIDQEIAQEIADRGPRFELEPSARDVVWERPDLERDELKRDELSPERDLGQDGHGYGD